MIHKLLPVLMIFISGLLLGCGSQEPTEKPPGTVFCHSTVQVFLPDRRLIATVQYPPGRLEDALNLIQHQELPPKPWPDGTRLTTHGGFCLENWEQVFERVNGVSFGTATRKLDASKPRDEANYRQAVLKSLFPEQFEQADHIFPKHSDASPDSAASKGE